MKVNDLMLNIKQFPVVDSKTILKEALVDMGEKNIGLICIVDNKCRLIGLFTDGDIRRMLLTNQKPFSSFFVDDVIIHANLTPLTVKPDVSIIDAIKLMGEREIWDLPVIDDNGILKGLLHLHHAISKFIEN
tara:strand:+ start:2402 stop:2797 length:396 start_codon:yes stop_codon:yes gene_type:complete